MNPRRMVGAVLALLMGALCVGVIVLNAQSFASGSDGSDGAYLATGTPRTIVFDPSQFNGTQVAANIFNFTTITIPAGFVIRLSANKINGPVIWLAQGDVNIQGVIDLTGQTGPAFTSNPFVRIPAEAGAGGYSGGVGGNQTQPPLSGAGPGGGAVGNCPGDGNGGGGAFSSNQFLIPLSGGAGGGGAILCGDPRFGPGGGGGGGALLIASSTQIIVGPLQAPGNGVIAGGGILATGGSGGGNAVNIGGGGAGGAIRLVANTITIKGSGLGASAPLDVSGGCGKDASHHGRAGMLRLEAFNVSGNYTAGGPGGVIVTGCTPGNSTVTGPFPLLLPSAGPPAARVVSIGGVAVNPNPGTFPDITINSAAAVPVVIQTHNIPATATITLTILDENGVPDTAIQAPPLGNCDQNNFCTTTVNVIFPFGASRGLTKVTWTP